MKGHSNSKKLGCLQDQLEILLESQTKNLETTIF